MTVDKLKELIAKMNEKGIPLPLFRDHDQASASLTLTMLSFINCVYVILKPGNSDSMMYALGLFGFCASGYFSRKWQLRKLNALEFISESEEKDGSEDLPVSSKQEEK